MAQPCAGKVALVTGASRGIGATIAERLAAAGAAVAVTARSVDAHPPNLPGTLRETAEPSMIEPIEAIAEAALALATCEPSLTGRITYSLPLLRELGREVRTLDGRSLVEVGR